MLTDHRDSPVNGIVLMMGFLILAPFIEVFAKLAAPQIPVTQIATARFIVQTACMLPLAFAMNVLVRVSRRDAMLFLLRGALILVSTACIVGAVKFMPIADAIAIVFVEPLLLTLVGGFLLGEEIGWRRITASIVGFIGCLLVIQPSFEAFGWVAFLPLGTAVAFGAYLLLSRTMAKRIHPVTLQAYTALGALCFALPALLLGTIIGASLFDPVVPSGIFWLWLLGGGLAATVSHIFLSYALRITPTTVIAPMQYLEIVSAAIFGYFIFGDFLNGLALVGAGIIVCAGLFVFWREQIAARSAAQEGVI